MELLRHQTTILEIYGITQLQMVVAIPNETWILNQQCSFYVPIYTQIQQDLHTKFVIYPTRIICDAIDSYSLQLDKILSWLTDS